MALSSADILIEGWMKLALALICGMQGAGEPLKRPRGHWMKARQRS
jgi:hypothetical protein